jgi:hypothetical protein
MSPASSVTVLDLQGFRSLEHRVVFPRLLVEMQAMARPYTGVGGLGRLEVEIGQYQVGGLKPRFASPN